MRYLRGPIVALLTFVIGVAISPIRFQMEGMDCGRVIDGRGGFSNIPNRDASLLYSSRLNAPLQIRYSSKHS